LAQLTHARTAGEGYSVGCLGSRIGIARGNATELRFFLLPYGVTAENQPFIKNHSIFYI
jgi:hypothetical protein